MRSHFHVLTLRPCEARLRDGLGGLVGRRRRAGRGVSSIADASSRKEQALGGVRGSSAEG